MKIFGYQKDNDNLLDMEKVSIQCTIPELEKLIDFFTEVKKEHSKVANETTMCHSHLKDWNTTWRKGEPDLIVVTPFKN